MIEDVKTKRQLYYLANKEKIIAKRMERYYANKETELQKMKEYKTCNPEKIRSLNKRYREENRDKCLETSRVYRETNGDKKREGQRLHYQRNRQQVLEANKQWKLRNPDKKAAANAKRRAAKKNACVSWADEEKIISFYTCAQHLTKTTGVVHDVDHIVPLINDIVCGLHNEFNLDVLTKSQNSSKGNRVWPDMPDTSDLELIEMVNEFKKRNSET
jgi:hypothetical protein